VSMKSRYRKDQLSSIYKFMPKLPETSLAYMAGLLDGEGYISLKKDTSSRSINVSYAPVIRITNTNLLMCFWCQDHFGGYVGVNKMADNGRWKKSYYWVVSRNNAVNALKCVSKYLLVKRDQSRIVILYSDTSNPRKKTDKTTLDYRSELRDKLSALNKRGPSGTVENEDSIVAFGDISGEYC
jgi:hypothetical protein